MWIYSPTDQGDQGRERERGARHRLPRLSLGALACVMTLAGALAGVGCDSEGFTTATSPDYVVRPTQDFRFTTLVVGRSTVKEVEIENVGSVDLLISDMIIQTNMSAVPAEGQPQEFSVAYQLPGVEAYEEVSFVESSSGDSVELSYPLVVAPTERMRLRVTYSPLDEVADSGAIYLNTNVIDNVNPERVRIDLPIIVSSGNAQISVTPARLDFDVVPAGEEKVLTLKVVNVGPVVLNISDIRIDGSQDFTPLINGRDPRRQPELLVDPDGDGLPGLSPFDENIEGSGAFSVEVRYLPPVAGPDGAFLVLTSNAYDTPELPVELLANSRNPCLNVLPEALEFPASLVSRTDSRDLLLESCGGATLDISEAYIEGDAEGVFAIEGELTLPISLPAADPQGIRPSDTLPIAFSPREQRIYNATLVLVSNDPVTPARRVNLLGRGAENICPQARAAQDEFYVLPLDTIVLDGSLSVDQDGPNNLPVEYEWVITARPEGSVSQPVERFTNPQQPSEGGRADDRETATALFFVDLPGYYTAELRVRDQFGLDSVACRNPAVVTIVARPDEAIQVQLSWASTLEEDISRERAADLDVHMLHPSASGWFSRPYDCYFNNPTPDWGQLDNPQDNPFLDLDDFSSDGPENLTLAVPENTDVLGGEYIVGVDYYRQSDRVDGYVYGPTRAFVRVFINGELAWDYTADGAPGYKMMMAEGHFWEAATISWPAGVVTTRDMYYEERPGN